MNWIVKWNDPVEPRSIMTAVTAETEDEAKGISRHAIEEELGQPPEKILAFPFEDSTGHTAHMPVEVTATQINNATALVVININGVCDARVSYAT